MIAACASGGLVCFASASQTYSIWIPAFAGMTKYEVNSKVARFREKRSAIATHLQRQPKQKLTAIPHRCPQLNAAAQKLGDQVVDQMQA